jgi:hypothetical protein
MSTQTTVTVNLGYTMNLGNFQSLRIDLGCTDFVRDGENVDLAMDRVYDFVETKVLTKIDEVKQEIKEIDD